MPGNNLQAKIFLSVAGGDSPDLVNQDDPVIPDWAHRGVIHSLEDIAQMTIDSENVVRALDWMNRCPTNRFRCYPLGRPRPKAVMPF